MKGLRQTTLWEFLNHIQNKTRSNISRVNHNKNKIEEYRTLVIENNIDTHELIQRLQIENDNLAEENTLLVKLHHKILSLNDELSNVNHISDNAGELSHSSAIAAPSSDECVKMVLENRMILSEDHPCMCDEKTVELIYKALVENERYEECSLLLKIRERNKKNQPSIK